MEIASHFAGRVRIRDERLKNDAVIAGAREALLATPGIAGVDGNPRVGSLLIHYAAAATGMERIIATISDFLTTTVEEVAGTVAATMKGATTRISAAIPASVKRNIVNMGMLASLLLSVAAGVLHLKKLHILAGIVFLALFGVHFIEKKEYLLV